MPQSPARSRMAALLSKALQSELSVYVLASGATGAGLLAASQPAAAQIVYTPAHSELNHDGVIRIDLNHDGLTDLLIREIPHENGGYLSANSLQAVPEGGAGVKTGLAPTRAAAMTLGSKIGVPDTFSAGPAVMFYAYGIYYSGSWAYSGTSRYLGIRFQINGQTHYGWARLTAKFGYYSYIDTILTGYAYETQPNKAIRAGDMGTGEADSRPTNETSSLNTGASGTLGALALGAKAIPIWRASE